MFKKMIDSPEGLPIINQPERRQLAEKKLNKSNIASYYKKQDIIKNKVKINSKLFKYAREKRLKTLINMEGGKEQDSLIEKKANQSVFFPTEPERQRK